MRRHAAIAAVLVGMGGGLAAVPGAVPADPPSAADFRAQLAAERRESARTEGALRRELAKARRARDRLARRARADPHGVQEALTLAAAVYGVPRSQLARVAWCESRHRPWARNASGASGLLQFMPGTYAGTPPGRAGLSVFSPYANALAAAWLVSRAGWRPWTCRP
jgi:soluble lytic murein transglycosylase-like protein